MVKPRRAFISLVAILAVIAAACAPQIDINEAALSPKNQSTKIFAADGTLITTLKQEENREILPLDAIPRHVRDAVVAIEDARFYSHRGVDAKAIMRAMYTNATSGEIIEGGSTITQQLVRNAVDLDVGKEQTMERKLREAQYAYAVEGKFSKDKILELYINTVYFGEGAYGIQTAGQTYFGKDAKDLTLAEAALLAGTIKSPVNYNPYTNADDALARRNRVLDRMYVNRFATQQAVAAAKGEVLGVQQKTEAIRYPAPYFIDYVTRLIQQDPKNQFTEIGESKADRANRLFRGGLRIHTTLDLKMQTAAEEAIGRVLDHPDQDPSASLVAVEPKTGAVRALVGGRDFFADEASDPCVSAGAINADGSPKRCAKVNLALGLDGGGTGRQSGSAFKPFVLATALNEGMKLSDVYPASACIDIANADGGGTRPWHVCNYEESAFGAVTVETATYKSINTVYAQIIRDLGDGKAYMGAPKVVSTAQAMGIESPLVAVPSAALGANAVSPLEMASAFATIPNLGIHVAPVAITKITDAAGTILWEAQQTKTTAISPSVSHFLLKALEGVIANGTGTRARIGRPAFGKTGTAQEWRDAWFVGGAGTDLVASVAIFWPDGEIEMKPACGEPPDYRIILDSRDQPLAIPPACRPTRIRVAGGTWPAQIWQLFMLTALEGIPASTFEVPEMDLVTVRVDFTRGCLPNPYTPAELIRSESFIAGTEPTEVCKEPTGPSMTRIPDVSRDHFPVETATRILEDQGYVVDVRYEPSSEYPPGRVLRQSPDGGTEAPEGTTVILWVSTAARTVRVPDVVGKTESEARQILEDAGLKMKVVERQGCAQPDPNCTIGFQEPKAGQSVAPGTEVQVKIRRNQG